MKRKFFKFCAHSSMICLEVAAIAIGLALLVCGLLVWRLLSGSLDVGFARSYIEQALHDPVSGYSVALGKVLVSWPDLGGPVMLDLEGVVLSKNGRKVLGIENASLGLAARHLMLGDVEPVSIILTRPSLTLIRSAGNNISLSLEEDQPQEVIGPPEKDPLTRIIDMLARPEDRVDPSSPLDNLENIEIRQARMVVADYLLGITWFLSPLDLAFTRDAAGLAVAASVELPGGRDGASRLQADLIYRRESGDFVANIHVQDFDPHILSRKIEQLSWLDVHYLILNGNARVAFGKNFTVNEASLSLSSLNGEIALEGVYDAPLPFESLYLEAAYDRAAGKAALKDMSLTSRGVTLALASEAVIAPDGRITAPTTLRIADLPQERIGPVWPDSLREDGGAEWLIGKLSKGRFFDVAASLTVEAARSIDDIWSIEVNDISGSAKIENMDIDYRAPLAPIKGAAGKASFADDVLTIEIEKAKLGDLEMAGARAVIDKVMAGKGTAKISMNLSGPLQGVFRYIEPEPIGVTEADLGMKIADVRGSADMSVDVSFPAIRDLPADKVKIAAQGTLRDVLFPGVVKNLDLTGGPFKASIADGAAALEGSGMLGGRPVKFGWKEYLDSAGKDFASRVSADLTADKGIRDALGIGLDDWIEGAFPVKVVYTEYGGGRAEASVAADLAPGSVMIAPLDHVKAPGVAGTATCKVLFKDGEVTEVDDLVVQAGELRMKGGRFIFQTLRGESELRRASIPVFNLEENQLNLDVQITADGKLKMAVKGPFLDARPFLKDENKNTDYDGPAIMASVAVERMRTHAARIVDRAKIYLDMNKSGDIDQFEMDAIAGAGDIYVRLKPNEKGLMSIRLEADDAGEMLRAFSIYENVKGGRIVLNGQAATPADRKILKGTVEMTDFYVVNAPVLAQLLSAISLFGIQQLLGGEGIYFSRLESDFEWQMIRAGDSYFFNEGRTSGSSLGLTFEGRIVKSADLIRMEGTIVPVSMISEIIGSIPLIGDILTGGGGGIIAATYKFEGPIKTPKVTVNPLSALAPGILRTILFE